MSGRSSLVAGAEQQAALRELAGSAVRGEAGEIATRFARDRARAVLLTLAGWTAGEIGEAFGVARAPCVAGGTGSPRAGWTRCARRWRPALLPNGANAPCLARALLAAPVQDRPNWTLLRLRAEIEARTGVRVSQGHLSVLLRKGAFAGDGPATA